MLRKKLTVLKKFIWSIVSLSRAARDTTGTGASSNSNMSEFGSATWFESNVVVVGDLPSSASLFVLAIEPSITFKHLQAINILSDLCFFFYLFFYSNPINITVVLLSKNIWHINWTDTSIAAYYLHLVFLFLRFYSTLNGVKRKKNCYCGRNRLALIVWTLMSPIQYSRCLFLVWLGSLDKKSTRQSH